MIRRIIKIDVEKCNGCGLCADACHEGAIKMKNGVATLIRDDYCDGLGDCLPVCPTGAITFEQRDTLAFDAEAVKANMQKNNSHQCSCPGSNVMELNKPEVSQTQAKPQNQLRNWPVQIKLAPVEASFFDGANLLIAADCCAYSYANFHFEYIKNHITLIGCPKLDMCDYTEKLTEIIKNNNINSVTVTRMTVPCCGGIQNAVVEAVANSGKNIPLKVVKISPDGNIVE